MNNDKIDMDRIAALEASFAAQTTKLTALERHLVTERRRSRIATAVLAAIAILAIGAWRVNAGTGAERVSVSDLKVIGEDGKTYIEIGPGAGSATPILQLFSDNGNPQVQVTHDAAGNGKVKIYHAKPGKSAEDDWETP